MSHNACMYRNMLRGYAIMSLSAGLDDQRQPIRGCHFLDWPITGRKRSAQEHILWLFGGWVIYDCLQVDQVTWWPSPGDIVIRVGNGLLWNGKVEWKPHYDENPKINLTISYVLFEHIPTYLYILLITYARCKVESSKTVLFPSRTSHENISVHLYFRIFEISSTIHSR